ncbi:hypothetical protein PMI42_04841 [Bradyrhizobium sp. YR681]|uniref:hypothetical protein n=1 Tax=Bradyrhizobium sp. YR681 TaxID=1144344 RepID=UPI0002710D2F|nr:hypothetical protein [Bradyrhizobium sp. YR681]EJN11827.1 hypothetical protein PMI42_04841 [Bradyrhizobium sp. YR681]
MNIVSSQSSNVPTASERFNLAQLSEVMLRRDRPAVGFFISQALWDAMVARWNQENFIRSLDPPPTTLHGIRIMVDPDLPDQEFDVALTEEAWSSRLAEINRGES